MAANGELNSGGGGGKDKNGDVAAGASTIRFSQPTIDKVAKAKVMLENYYNNLLQECDERVERYRRLEEQMQLQMLSEQEKSERRMLHALKETEFLRLKRLKLTPVTEAVIIEPPIPPQLVSVPDTLPTTLLQGFFFIILFFQVFL